MTDENIIVDSPLRTGKTQIMKILKDIPYKNYNYSMTDIMNEAIEMERRHTLNCSNRPIDRSPKAENQRILNNIKRLKKQRGYI